MTKLFQRRKSLLESMNESMRRELALADRNRTRAVKRRSRTPGDFFGPGGAGPPSSTGSAPVIPDEVAARYSPSPVRDLDELIEPSPSVRRKRKGHASKQTQRPLSASPSLTSLVKAGSSSSGSQTTVPEAPGSSTSSEFRDDPRYELKYTLKDLPDIGKLRVTLVSAKGLFAADFGGRSDPFAELVLRDVKYTSRTVPKTLNPEWNQTYVFPIKDMADILHIRILDEDRFQTPEFLGRLAIPLLRIKSNEFDQSFALKWKRLDRRARGSHPQLVLRLNIVWNPVRAAIKTIKIKDEPAAETFKRYLFVANVQRMRRILGFAKACSAYINSCFEWRNRERSIKAFFAYELAVYYFQPFMAPLLLLVFMAVYPRYSKDMAFFEWHDPDEAVDDADDADDDDNDSSKNGASGDKKTVMERLKALQDVTASVQNALGSTASFAERVKNLLNFSEPFLSCVFVLFLAFATLLLWAVSLRWLLMAFGVHKFTKRLLRPNAVSSNEVANFLARVPDDPTLDKCRPLSLFDPQLLKEEEEKAAKKEMKLQLQLQQAGGSNVAKGPIVARVTSFLRKDNSSKAPGELGAVPKRQS